MTNDSDGRKLLLWMCGLGLVVHLPLLAGLVQRLWAEEHYQHVPLVLAAAVGLAYFRWPEVVATAAWSWPGVLLLAVQLPLMLLAFAGNSHWLGAVSLVLYLAAACLLFGGWTTTRLLAGPLFLLLLCIPLPLQQDIALVTGLQKLAATLASGTLDLAGLRHRLQGVAIHTPDKTYFVEEACSGVNSLFSSIAFFAFYLLYRRHHWLRFLASLSQVAVWVLLVNAARIFLVVYADQRWDWDMTTGLGHQLLGGVFFGVIVLLSISGDYLLLALFPRYSAEFRAPETAAPTPWRTAPYFARGLAAVVVLLAISGVTLRFRQDRSPGEANAMAVIQGLTEDALPETIGAWRRVEFRTERREQGAMEGAASSIWRLTRGQTTVYFSIDGPFTRWHDLAYCYSALNWKLMDAANLELPRNAAEGDTQPCTLLEFVTDQDQPALVFFTCYDADNRPVAPLDPSGHFLRRLWDRMEAASPWSSRASAGDIKPPVIQAQMQVVSEGEMLESERAELETLFDQLRRLARRNAVALGPVPTRSR